MNKITEAEDFYGYIIGLQVERNPHLGPYSEIGRRLYATFEYNGKVKMFSVVTRTFS